MSKPGALAALADQNSVPDGASRRFPYTRPGVNRIYLTKLEKGASYPEREIIASLARRCWRSSRRSC